MPIPAPDINLLPIIGVPLDAETIERIADAVAVRILDQLPKPGEKRHGLKSPEAADYLGVSVETVRDLVACGKLTRHQTSTGGPLRFEADDLDAYQRRYRIEASN